MAKRPSFSSPKDYARWFASQGGKARKRAMTAEERTAGAKKAARARWSKTKKRSTT
jgi:hypothetical protein